jgi:hypothetical protein
MKKWVGHAIFAGVLTVSLAVNNRMGDVPATSGDILAAVRSVARSHDLSFQKGTSIADITVLTFRVPGCSRPLLMAPLDVGLDQLALLQAIRGDGYAPRYAYLDQAWNKPDRFAVFLEWKVHTALAVFGLTRYVVSPYLLLIDAPQDCRTLDAIDWRLVWDRNYLAQLKTVGNNSER